MKIKVGEYVKLKRGEIFKIDENTTNYYNSNKEFITNEITKHSESIMDLIEVGDVIKYKELRDWSMYGTKANETYILNLKSQKEIDKFKKCVEDKDIKFISIVTKEQFKEMEYKV